MKRTILTLCLLPFSFPSLSATTDLGVKGTLKFVLKTSRGVCELVEDSIEVDMGLVALKKPVRIGTELNPTTLSTGLKNCSEVVGACATMDGAPNTDNPNPFAPDTGGATSVGLKVKTPAGVQQFPKNTIPTPIELAINGDGVHQLNYTASYVPLCADATIGRADAVADSTAQYE